MAGPCCYRMRKMPTKIAKIQESINPSKQMIGRNVVLEIKRIEQLLLPVRLMPHHRHRSLSNTLLSA